MVASALEGYFIGLGAMRSMVLRVILLIGGMLIAFPEIITTMIGFLIIAASIGLMVMIRKRSGAAAGGIGNH
jgi:large-conductance mechanosensitive channel